MKINGVTVIPGNHLSCHEPMHINVQIVDTKIGKKLRLFPTSKAWNVIVSEDPLTTLDEWLREQEKLNDLFSQAFNKISALEKASKMYEASEEMPTPNPFRHMLWARLIEEVEPIKSVASCHCEDFRSRIDILTHDPMNPKEGYMWMVSADATQTDPVEPPDDDMLACGCEDHRSKVDVLKSTPINPEDGYMWVVKK